MQQSVKRDILIGLNGSMLDEHPTGVGVYSYNVINKLTGFYKNSNRKITVFTPAVSLLNKDIRVVLLTKRMQSSQYGKMAAATRFLWNTFFYPLQARNFDLLLSTTTHGSFFLKNQVITIHDLLSLRFENISSHQRFYFKYLLPYMVKKARLVIAVSETTKQDIIHYLKCPAEKVKVIYNGYDETVYNTLHPAGGAFEKAYNVKNYFLAVGPTYPHKNFERLIEAYSALSTTIKEKYPLVIAGGKKAYVEGLKRLVQEKGQTGSIYFTGYVPSSLMSAMYREAFALIFPSLFEGFGFPLIEAMACGCPVLASDVSSVPEVCGDAALYFDPTDVTGVANAMQQLIADAPLRDGLREKGLLRCKIFSWQKTVNEFSNVIEKLLSETHKKNIND